MLPEDLPQDFLEFNARFGIDEQCREYLFQARWPDGFRCDGCGHGDVYALRTRLVHECAACGKQHSLLAGTLFEQTKTGLARWFLAVYLVTSSKGGQALVACPTGWKDGPASPWCRSATSPSCPCTPPGPRAAAAGGITLSTGSRLATGRMPAPSSRIRAAMRRPGSGRGC